MVSSKQRQEIKRRMRRIKDARDKGLGKEAIKNRSMELIEYLQDEGLYDIY